MTSSSQRVAALLATWFGCGYSPVAPGTAGSLGALAVAVPLHLYAGAGPVAIGLLGVAILLPGIWAADVTARAVKREDPGLVVIDEVSGQWITLAGATHLNWKSWLLGFLIFRILDVIKPPPVRQFEDFPGGVGIMMDDVMAGIYGALVLYAAGWFNLY